MEGRTIIKWVLVGFGGVIIVGYSMFALGGLFLGPKIEVISPMGGFATTSSLVAVSGRLTRANTLVLNGATTSIDLAGNFSESLLLAEGYNIITLEATDRYKRTVEEKIEVTLIVEKLKVESQKVDADAFILETL